MIVEQLQHQRPEKRMRRKVSDNIKWSKDLRTYFAVKIRCHKESIAIMEKTSDHVAASVDVSVPHDLARRAELMTMTGLCCWRMNLVAAAADFRGAVFVDKEGFASFWFKVIHRCEDLSWCCTRISIEKSSLEISKYI